jgi:hypothetical protein
MAGGLPADLLASRPRLLLGQTLFALVSGQVDDAAGPLDAAERAAAHAADEPYEPSVGRAASLVANIPATIALARAFDAELRGDPDTCFAAAEDLGGAGGSKAADRGPVGRIDRAAGELADLVAQRPPVGRPTRSST